MSRTKAEAGLLGAEGDGRLVLCSVPPLVPERTENQRGQRKEEYRGRSREPERKEKEADRGRSKLRPANRELGFLFC